jgi:hypothetical protein
MYKQLHIQNFRGIADLTISDLARINLFVGPNNIGKTSLLEALLLFQTPGAPGITLAANQARGLLEPQSPELLWHSLFRGMAPGQAITIEGTDSQDVRRALTITLTRSETERVTPQIEAPPPPGFSAPGIAPLPAPAEILHFRYQIDNAEPEETQARISGQMQEFQNRADLTHGNTAFLPLGPALSPQSLATLFTQVQDSGDLDSLVESLRPLQPGLRSLSLGFVEGWPLIRAHVEGIGRPLPLQFFGGGMGRLAAILLTTLTVAVVLIDEIDTGIYYENLVGAWQSVDVASARTGTQIFATTHSLECVRAGVVAFQGEHAADLRIYRIERRKGKLCAVAYDRETAAAALDLGLEVR